MTIESCLLSMDSMLSVGLERRGISRLGCRDPVSVLPDCRLPRCAFVQIGDREIDR